MHPQFYLVLVVVIEKYDYVFPENGLVAYKDGKLLCKQVSSQVYSSSCITTNMSYVSQHGWSRKVKSSGAAGLESEFKTNLSNLMRHCLKIYKNSKEKGDIEQHITCDNE